MSQDGDNNLKAQTVSNTAANAAPTSVVSAENTATNRRRGEERKGVIFDEENLRQNKEWHEAHPVTKHIDEPKTPYHHDEGEYSDEEEQGENKEKKGQRAASQDGESNQQPPQQQQTKTEKGEEGEQQENSWQNAEYNKLGKQALLQEPIHYTSVAPVLENNNKEDAAEEKGGGGGEQKKKKPSIALDEKALSAEAQEEAEKKRQEAEFKAMRKAVYKDEGNKFKELLKQAQNQDDDEDENDDDQKEGEK